MRLLTYLRLRIGYNDKLPETQNLIWINCNFPHLAMAWAREFNVIYFHPTENMSLMLTVPCLVCISSWVPYNYYFILSRERDRKSKMINEMLANLCLHYQWPKATHWIFQHSLARNAFYFFVIITILVLAFQMCTHNDRNYFLVFAVVQQIMITFFTNHFWRGGKHRAL